ncbi:MAG: GNAT family N-acetyltransferase [Thermoguttaceae bacterium]
MAQGLRVQAFSASLLPDVQDFSCGDDPWQAEVAQWLKGESDDNALQRMAHGTEVWLYRNAQRDVVGYGSLGKTEWRWPPPNGPREIVSIIPYFGVQTRFQGEPRGGPRDERFGYQIMRDLLAKALRHGTRILGLFVDADNGRAVRFYEHVGFVTLPPAGKKYLRMYLYLREQPGSGSPSATAADSADVSSGS